jgi:hypothetical protein
MKTKQNAPLPSVSSLSEDLKLPTNDHNLSFHVHMYQDGHDLMRIYRANHKLAQSNVDDFEWDLNDYSAL